MSSKRSIVWDHFKSSDEPLKAICNICKEKLSSKGSVSNLKKHLSRKHPTVSLVYAREDRLEHLRPVQELERLQKTINTVIQPTTSAHRVHEESPSLTELENQPVINTLPVVSLSSQYSKSSFQTNISKYIPNKISLSEKQKIDDAVFKLFVWDYQPFLIVEDRGFTNLMKTVAPSYTLPSRKYFANTMLPAIYEKKKTELREELEREAQTVCITTDIWTSSVNDSYMAVTAHFINNEFVLKSALLDCQCLPGSHTGVNIAREIERIVREFNLMNKILITISDNGANVVNAVQQELQWKHFGCYAHTLNLAVKHALDSRGIQDVIQKTKVIVSYFKRSCLATDKLRTIQEQSGSSPPKKLLQEVSTRWNSTYFMLKRIVEIQEAVKSALAILNMNYLTLSAHEWIVCAELCQVLQPIEEVSRQMSGQKYVTASSIIPITRGLKSVLTNLSLKPFDEIVLDTIELMSNGLKKRFGNLEKNDIITMCMFLDPRFKLYFEDEPVAERTKKNVIDMVAALMNKDKCLDVIDEPVANTENDSSENMSIWDDYNHAMSEIRPKGTANSRAIVEVQRYLDDKVLSRNHDPLEWWKQHQLIYPSLAALVKTRFNMLATSVPCERLFSAAGNIVTDRRTRLGVRKLQQLLFLNTNM